MKSWFALLIATLALLTSNTTLAGGDVKMIPVQTPKGTFEVYTRKVGDNPKIKLLLLHGGPGATHEYFEILDQYLPAQDIEYYYYDQLGSAFSDQPDEPALWEIPRFVDEVEQVRQALGLNKDNFFLLGHSWGGILAIEYALQHQQHLKGLIISNMMASVPEYNRYADQVLKTTIDPAVLAELQAIEAAGDFANPRYMELLVPNHYEKHVLRMLAEQWPDAVNRAFSKINNSIYIPLQGPSELGASGKLENWQRFEELKTITVPTLVIAATHDTMEPAYMESMASALPNGEYLLCPNGSHMAMWDDADNYAGGLIAFLQKHK
ncbi:proline iminopeptidase-family hydrolase [Pseudobowmanella zhangzhouensis]|uniref:Proline iminopeptidase-family hydrolase n=2 Tax=Pseudobowmanella zhangzhouensis TaxID=1537679 RepID=A0ABW1XFP8_9ALTE